MNTLKTLATVAVGTALLALAPGLAPGQPTEQAPKGGNTPTAAAAPGAGAGAGADAATIKDLVQKLGDGDYQTRENAEKKLKEIGAPASDELTKAMDSDDAEIKDRATRLVQTMRRDAVRKDTEIKWRYKTDNNQPLTTALTLHDGVIYAAAGADLVAIDALTGNFKSKMTVGGSIASVPAFVDNRICVVGGDHVLWAFELGTGKFKWRQFERDSVDLGTPTAGKGVVLVAGPNKLYGVDAATGRLAWPPVAVPTGIVGAPAVSGDAIYVATNDGNLLAFDATGKPTGWTVAAGSDCTTGPTVGADGTLFVGTSEGLLAVDVQKKAKAWSYAVPTGNDPQQVQILQQQMIMIRQQQAQGQQQGLVNPGMPAPVLEGGVAYLSAGGKLHAVDTATGQGKWSFEPEVADAQDAAGEEMQMRRQIMIMQRGGFGGGMGMGGMSAPLVIGKTAYVGTPQGLFAVEVKNGLQLWRYSTSTPVLGRPLVAGDNLVFGNGVDMFGNMGFNGRIRRLPVQPGNAQGSIYEVIALPIKTANPAIPVAK